jgi:hypothetical protein
VSEGYTDQDALERDQVREIAELEDRMSEDVIDGEAVEIADELPVLAAPTGSTALVAQDEISVAQLVGQSQVIHAAMKEAMQEGIHYGKIPGVDKPTLLKPGAEKLLVLFRLAPEYDSEKIWHDDGHLTVMVKCSLRHIPTGLKIAEGEGLCTTRESRYAWRKGGRLCPVCNQPAIIKGKAEYGGGWLCYGKKGGCGAKWEDGTPEAEEFENANLDRVANPDLPDSYNTVLKMGDKRALLAAILNGTAASDVFTQDMEDRAGSSAAAEDPELPPEPKEPAKFDPAKTLRDDAPRGGWKKISDQLMDIDPSIDWAPMIRQAIQAVFGGDGDFRKLKGDARSAAAYRAANVAGKISELFTQETFLSNESIQKAFAEMFDGVVVDIPTPDFVPDELPGTEGHVGTASPDE